jgi:cardiolipin synthase
MLHAKVVVIDDELALCGSVNLDGRSLFLNYELMTAFYGRTQIDWLAAWLARRAGASQRYTARTPALSRDVLEGVVRSVGFQL